MRWRYLIGLATILVAVGGLRNAGCGEESPCGDCSDDDPCTIDQCSSRRVGEPPGMCEPDERPVEPYCSHRTEPDGTSCVGGLCINGGCVEFDGIWPCTEQGIRHAIAAGGGPHTFDCSSRTPVVTQAEIEIDNDVILDGEGNLIVEASGGHRVFSVADGITAELVGVTVTGGHSSLGGGIFNEGDLTLTNSTVSGNVSEGDGGGIGISRGSLTLINSTVSGNVSGSSGGGIGGGGDLTLTNSTVSGNSSEGLGGGIGGGIGLTLINSTVSGNTSNQNNGGGIGSWGNLTLINSTVSGNTANSGGGIESGVNLNMTNSTVSGNTGWSGIAISGTLTMTNSTVWGNEGSAVKNWDGTVTVAKSLVDGDCSSEGVITSNGYNIESPNNTCGFDQSTDQVNVSADDLNLGPLQDNGGPTKTHALLPGSIAIDWISVEDCVDADGERLTTDQRGFLRDSMCDVGAYEFGAQEAQPSGGGGGCSLVHREDAPGIWLLAVLALLGIRLASRRKAKEGIGR